MEVEAGVVVRDTDVGEREEVLVVRRAGRLSALRPGKVRLRCFLIRLGEHLRGLEAAFAHVAEDEHPERGR